MAGDRSELPLNALRAFEGVAKYKSFAAAATALMTSPSALSRHVVGLERYLGTLLFERRPHALVLTKAGEKLLPVVSRSFDQLGQAIDLRRNEGIPARTLRVQMPPSFAAKIVAPRLGEFRRANPDVEIDLLSLCEVGLPPIDLDIAVVYARPQPSDGAQRLLWTERFSVLCSRGVAAGAGSKSVHELLDSNELLHVRVAELPRYHVWTQFARAHGTLESAMERGLIFDTALLAAEYLASADGIALLDARLFRQELSSGTLVRLADTEIELGYGYYVVTDADDGAEPAVAGFREWVTALCETPAAT